MQSIYWTGRLLSRALWNGIASYSSSYSAEQQPNVIVAGNSKRCEASLVSAVCGFPKDFARGRIRRGQFGDDAWFTAKFKAAEVIGKTSRMLVNIFFFLSAIDRLDRFLLSSISCFKSRTCIRAHPFIYLRSLECRKQDNVVIFCFI
jgi:hypothetical protein